MNFEESQKRRQELAASNAELRSKLILLNSQINGRGWLDTREFQGLRNQRGQITAAIARNDAELSKLRSIAIETHAKRVLTDWQSQGKLRNETLEKPTEEPRKLIITRLNELRDEYEALSVDHRITSSCRRMSAEFVLKINFIIKEALSTKS